jgi:hypothetical protein
MRYRWVWFALACVAVASWLWTQRYEYIGCTELQYCYVADRWTGEIGIQLTELKRQQTLDKAPSAERREQLDSLFDAIAP